MGLPRLFPSCKVDKHYNPAIRLFGLRFIRDQSIVEYLSEFLSIVYSDKRIFHNETIVSPFPSFEDLRKWSSEETAERLRYKPPVKLNLKLFAFLGASPTDKRHDIHGKQYIELANKLEDNIRAINKEPEEVRECIEDFLKGFQGAGFNRTWCAQTFYPVSSSLLTRETIWNETVARRYSVQTWENSIYDFGTYYSTSKRDFLARGGEVLYLQLCNALSTPQEDMDEFLQNIGFYFDEDERNLERLHNSLQYGLRQLDGQHTVPLDNLVDYVDNLDENTNKLTNDNSGEVQSGWCPRDSWPEGYLFAVELNRILTATLDHMDRLELMMTGCVLQVLRSLCAQSVRYAQELLSSAEGGALRYCWVFSPPGSSTRQQRLISQRNLQVVQGLIQGALRNDALKEYVRSNPKNDNDVKVRRLYKEADDKYGHRLFLALGKRLGIIIPQRGPGARFIMTEKALRYFVVTLLRPGELLTYDEFVARLYCHYGIAIEGSYIEDAMRWSGLPPNDSVQSGRELWLPEMLRAGGFLTELSDACAIVHNPFGNSRN
jgi:hypothetical protein